MWTVGVAAITLGRQTCRDTSQYGQTTTFQRFYGVGTGTFVEFGCANGVENSNTYMLECLGWSGFCVEPVDQIRSRAHGYQGAVCEPGQHRVNITVAGLSGLHGVQPNLAPFGVKAVGQKSVECYNLFDLRYKHGLEHVTYMTVDTEGNEADILRAYAPLDWVDWLQVECNTKEACDELRALLIGNFSLMRFFPFHNGRGGGDLLLRRRSVVKDLL